MISAADFIMDGGEKKNNVLKKCLSKTRAFCRIEIHEIQAGFTLTSFD